jgi:hypothetical protein
MTLPLWGQLDKAQDDDQKIVQAIAEAIAQHEADPEAHLGEGESLSEHKQEGIIDHPQGSLVPDKFSPTSGFYNLNFTTNNNWQILGSGGTGLGPGIAIDVADGDIETSRMRTVALVPGGFLRVDRDAIFDAGLYVSTEDNTYQLAFGFGASQLAPDAGFGFTRDSNGFRGYVKIGSTTNFTAALTVDLEIFNSFRAYYSALDDAVLFSINGVQVASLSRPSGTWNIDPWFSFWIKANGDESAAAGIAPISFGVDLS